VTIASEIQVLILSMCLLCTCALPLAAQTTDAGGAAAQSGGTPQDTGNQGESDGAPLTRPFRGLFGLGDTGRTGAALSGELFGAYDDNVSATLPGRPRDPRYQRSGWYSGANSQLQLNWRGERAAMNGWASAGTSYYPDFPEPFVPSYSAGLGFSRPLGQRNSMRVGQLFQYSPYFLNGFFPDPAQLDEVPLPPVELGPGNDVSGNTIARYSTIVGFSRQLSRSATFTTGYTFSRSNYSDYDRTYQEQRGSVSFIRRLTRHASLRLGYAYRSVVQEIGALGLPDLENHMQDIQAGIDYNRTIALSMSRRTRVSFSTGTAYIARSDLSGSELDQRRRSRFYVTGTAEITHEMGRTWKAAAIYRRSAGFSELVFEPVTSDSVSATLSGLLGRRIEVSALAGASRGEVGDFRTNDHFTSYRATAQVRRALNRYMAAHVTYLFYQHDFGNQINLPIGFPQSLDRQGVQFGLSVWLPLH
jgi:hypothetical protein